MAKILDVEINFDITESKVLEKISTFVEDNGVSSAHTIFTINPEFIMQAQKDKEFLEILNSSDLNVADGAGLLFAKDYYSRIAVIEKNWLFPFKAFLIGIKLGLSRRNALIGERISGSDLIYSISEHAAKKGYTLALVGGWKKDRWGRRKPLHGDVAGKAAKELKKLYPGLKIVYANSDISFKRTDDAKFLVEIKQSMKQQGVTNIDIIYAAFPSLHQEKWLKRNMSKIPVRVGLGLGGSFDFVAGIYSRSPNFMTKSNLEWLYRLIKQPWRFRRIFSAFPVFPLSVYLDSLKTVDMD